ncbi:MAG: SusD/RagB family nutrient-binding outer membrane lipoprotein, partial [Ginsengibacter sp.]
KYGYAGGTSGSANFFGPLRNNLNSTALFTESAIRQSAFIANLMSGLNSRFPTGTTDPRAIYMLRLNNNLTFKGLTPNKGQLALVAGDRPETFHGISQFTTSAATPSINTNPGNDNNCRFIFTNTAPTPILTSSEIYFMKSEALYRKGDKAGAQAAYKQGISEDFDMLTTVYNKNIPAGMEITPASKAAYLTNPLIVPDPSGLTLSHIMLQKYIALWGYGVLETWGDMRRYHYVDKENGQQVYADFAPPSGVDLYPDNQPNRFVYRERPRYNSEYVWNKNELIRIGADKPDYHLKEMWFSMP